MDWVALHLKLSIFSWKHVKEKSKFVNRILSWHCCFYVTVSLTLQMLMNAKKRKPVSALNAAAKTHGVATSALAVGIFCISGTMIPA